MPIAHVEVTEESYEQLVRVNQGKGSTKRITVEQPMRLVMGKPEDHPWVCACGNTEAKAARTAEQRLALVMKQDELRMRWGGMKST